MFTTSADAGTTDAEGRFTAAIDMPPALSGASQPMDATFVMSVREGAGRPVERADQRLVVPARGAAWPAYDFDPEAWRITFRAGYGDAGEAVPSPIRSAILLLVADLFDQRDGKVQANLVDNPTVDRLLAPFRRVAV